MASARKKPRFPKAAVGTPRTRRMQGYLIDHIHALTGQQTLADGATAAGLSINDVRNFRAGNRPSLHFVISMVKSLRITPDSLVARGDLEPLARGRRTAGAEITKICARLRKIAMAHEPAALAKATGLPISSIYHLRSHKKTVGLHVFLGFVSAGYGAGDLLLG